MKFEEIVLRRGMFRPPHWKKSSACIEETPALFLRVHLPNSAGVLGRGFEAATLNSADQPATKRATVGSFLFIKRSY